MSTTLDPNKKSKGRKYVDFDEFIDYQVNKTRAGIKSADLLTAVVTVALALCGYVLAFSVLDQWVIEGGFGALPRLLMLLAVVGFAATWIIWKVVLPYMRRITTLYAAKEIEHTQPELKSSLLTLMDLKRAGRRIPPHITSAMEKRAAVSLSHMDVDQAVDRRPLMRMSYALLAIVVAICLYTVFSPKSISASLMRALLPLSDRAVATRTRIDAVDPGDAEVLARSQLDVTVDLSGEIPEEVTLLYTTADHSLVDEPLAMRDTGEGLNRFRGVLTGPNGKGLLQDLRYTIAAGDARSREYSVTVTQAPYATVEEIVYEYPDYMQLASRTQPGGEIDAWEGTYVTIRATANMPVTSATVLLSDTDDTTLKAEELPMTLVDSTHLEARFQLKFRSDGTYAHFYRIQLKAEDGQTDPVPRLYSVSIRRDLPPKIELLHPTGDVELPANGVLPIAYQASDPDFMLRKIEQRFSRDDEPLPTHTRTLYAAPPERSRMDGTGRIDLRDFNLAPGDVLTFWLTAWDNMEPLGAKSGNSTSTPAINIIIVAPQSDEEVQQQLENEQAQAEQRLDEARQAEQQQGDAEQSGDPSEADDSSDPADAGEEMTETEPSDAAGQDASSETGGTNETPDAATEPREGDPQASETGEPQEGDPQGEGDDAAQSKPSDSGDDGTEGANAGEKTGERPRDGEDGATQHASRDGQRQSSPREPGDEAADDEALRKLFEEFEEDIERQRAESKNDGDDSQQDENAAASETGDDANRSDDQSGDSPNRTGDSPQSERPQQRGSDSSDESGMNETPGNETGSPDGKEPMTDSSTTPDGPGTNSDPRRNDSSEQGTGAKNSESDGASAGNKPADQMQDSPGTGDDRPSDGDDPGEPKPGDVDGPGETKPGNDPGSEPKPSDMPADGEPTDDPATRPSEKPTPGEPGRKPSQTGGSENPEGADPASMTEPGDDSEPGDRGSSPGEGEKSDRPSAKTDGQPSGPDDSEPGEGRKDGQRSEQPAGGEKGSSQQASEGTKGGQKPGPGDATEKTGSQTDAEGTEGGRPGDKPGEGSTSKPGGEKPGGEGEGSSTEEADGGDMPGEGSNSAGAKPGSEGSENKSGEGSGENPGEGSDGEGSGGEGSGEGAAAGDSSSEKSGNKPSQGKGPGDSGSQPGEGQAAEGANTGAGGTSGAEAPEGAGNAPAGDLTPEEADLQDKRRATELVLERLQDELQRGEVSPELLDELGWTEDNLRNFMQRLESRLADTGDDDSPEARARRRQFETLLRGIDFNSQSTAREAGDGPRSAEGGFNVQRRPAPSEFQADEEAFKKRLSRETKK